MQVYINDELVLSCGQDEAQMLGATIYAHGELGDVSSLNEPDNLPKFDVNFGGITNKALRKNVKWPTGKEIVLTDKITIQFTTSETADSPVSEGLSTQSTAERAHWENAKKLYLELRDKYEDNDQ